MALKTNDPPAFGMFEIAVTFRRWRFYPLCLPFSTTSWSFTKETSWEEAQRLSAMAAELPLCLRCNVRWAKK